MPRPYTRKTTSNLSGNQSTNQVIIQLLHTVIGLLQNTQTSASTGWNRGTRTMSISTGRRGRRAKLQTMPQKKAA